MEVIERILTGSMNFKAGVRWDKKRCGGNSRLSLPFIFFLAHVLHSSLLLQACFLNFLVQMVENSLYQQFQYLHVLYSREQTD